MPRNDGTGHMEMGAMTGRGMGSCVEFITAGSMDPALGRGMSNGCGRRRMHGSGGRGVEWKQKCVRTAHEMAVSVPNTSSVSVQTELKLLKNQANNLVIVLEGINKRLSELNAEKK
jgi:hypothetical protein